MSEIKQYRLYASYTKKIPDGVEYSLQPFGTKYILCFTDMELREPYREIPLETPLNEQESSWLLECKIAVNAKYMKEHEEENVAFLNEFFNLVEKELKKEKKMEGKN